MKSICSILLFCFFISNATVAQDSKIPDWFLQNLEKSIGVWETSNEEYMSDQEIYDTYVLEWEWGIGETSIIGHMYGVTNGKEGDDIWEFRQYWDNEKQEAVVLQYGYNGVVGKGTLKPYDYGQLESMQTFSLPDGRTWKVRHVVFLKNDVQSTTSYNEGEDGTWKSDRGYLWNRI